ncbi:MAG: FAD-dependent oxidoreductase [Desulfobacterales bacterium]|nr:FAD-dependent oxidoreductase [Desulfobacterales bacterium]
MTRSSIHPSDLPDHLAERIAIRKDGPLDTGKPYVLCWLHHAIRDHENPALDVALFVGNEIERPVLVYQGLGGNHAYNADRHHVFIMEGARDLQQGLARRGIAYRFHLPEIPEQPGPLRKLAHDAAIVITETFPAPPFPRWTAALAKQIAKPLWTVDCSCIVPMANVGRLFERAFQFRKHTQQAFDVRLTRPWQDQAPQVDPFAGVLPFEGLDLQAADLEGLSARCRIDHGIGPVPHTRGGSQAGYARWEAFKRDGLRAYARLRNDAAVMPPRGVSRLSPYLHYGMVSPLRIAREAAADGSAGAEKFLDELLIWRELAHNFCFHTPDPENLSSLPDWARETLARHGDDPRPVLYPPEQLERARTGEPLWDAAQRSLLHHGELHNNLRMTWGKALLAWTPSPTEALQSLIDLNHRFALDGCDPNSYGGILWCLGLFDRPFHPEQPVSGALRTRPLAGHARRLDLARYRRKVDPPASGTALKIAVIGAGLAGLRAAGILVDHGHRVTVYENEDAPGGRLAGFEWAGTAVDAGAQYFTARDPRFRRHVKAWMASGHVVPWDAPLAAVDAPGAFRPLQSDLVRYVAVPDMRQLAVHLARDLDVRYGATVEKLAPDSGGWRPELTDSGMQERYDAVILAVPPRQAEALLPPQSKLTSRVAEVRMQSCWALMAVFASPLDLPWDGIFFNRGPLSWAARNASKPGRTGQAIWMLHAARDWPQDRANMANTDIQAQMLEEFFHFIDRPPVSPLHTESRYWTAAAAVEALDEGCLWHREESIGICGDWCAGSRIEGAFLSGSAVAGRLLAHAARLAVPREQSSDGFTA